MLFSQHPHQHFHLYLLLLLNLIVTFDPFLLSVLTRICHLQSKFLPSSSWASLGEKWLENLFLGAFALTGSTEVKSFRLFFFYMVSKLARGLRWHYNPRKSFRPDPVKLTVPDVELFQIVQKHFHSTNAEFHTFSLILLILMKISQHTYKLDNLSSKLSSDHSRILLTISFTFVKILLSNSSKSINWPEFVREMYQNY